MKARIIRRTISNEWEALADKLYGETFLEMRGLDLETMGNTLKEEYETGYIAKIDSTGITYASGRKVSFKK